MEVLMLSPEPPYPLNGGGAFRTASLLNYFARFASVDLILISNTGAPALLPDGLVRRQQVIPLTRHSTAPAARFVRNARRAIMGVPPLIDRLSGLAEAIRRAVASRRYDVCVIEHFWCAPYLEVLSGSCTEILLDLHNIESVLHQRCVILGNGLRHGVLNAVSEELIRAGHRRFAAASRILEERLLPRYASVLVASEEDAQQVRRIAPAARVHVYPNALPYIPEPRSTERDCLVFSANFEYHPNIDAVGFFLNDIWPLVRKIRPGLQLRLVGRGDGFIRHLLPPGPSEDTGVEVTGAVDDAMAEIAQARIVIAPLRAGSGTRIKILEAWNAARCVVATPLAAEGIRAEDGVNLALASDPRQFAETIDTLLGDQLLRQRLGDAGRRTFVNHYSWHKVWEDLDLALQLTR